MKLRKCLNSFSQPEARQITPRWRISQTISCHSSRDACGIQNENFPHRNAHSIENHWSQLFYGTRDNAKSFYRNIFDCLEINVYDWLEALPLHILSSMF